MFKKKLSLKLILHMYVYYTFTVCLYMHIHFQPGRLYGIAKLPLLYVSYENMT